MKIFDSDLILEKSTIFNESITVKGDILCRYKGKYDLTVNGSIIAGDIKVGNLRADDITAKNIDALDISAFDIIAGDISAFDIIAGDINVENIEYYAICLAYFHLKCKSIRGKRDNSNHFCLDEEIEYKKEGK